jgi:hypothetical protein
MIKSTDASDRLHAGKELQFHYKKNPRRPRAHKRTIICPRKKKAELLKKSSRLGTTSDLVVVHNLILSLSILFYIPLLREQSPRSYFTGSFLQCD